MRNYLPFVFALLTALSWGLYGPTLSVARLADADHSPFKPYVGIGFAYLIIAILGGLIGIWYKGDSFNLTSPGVTWGFVAGILGAIGAFGLTMSMFSGGANIPHAVMPVVFGGAVTITALYTLMRSTGQFNANPLLWIGIAGVIFSTILITTNTPHTKPSAPSETAPVSSQEKSIAVVPEKSARPFP